MMNNGKNKLIMTLPFNDFRVNLYNYTALNKLREIRLIRQVKIKNRPPDSFKYIM